MTIHPHSKIALVPFEPPSAATDSHTSDFEVCPRSTSPINRWIAAIASATGLMIPLWLLYDSGDAGIAPVIFLFSGYAFSMRPVITGGALDQPSLFKELFILGYSLLAICPCIAFVRRLNSRTHRIVRSIFAILSLIILLHPLSILTIYTYDVSRYTLQMGVTPKRLLGLALGLSVFVAMSCFVLWICRPNTRKFAQYAQWTVAAIEN